MRRVLQAGKSHAAIALLLGGCALAPVPEGQFIVGGHAVKVEASDRASIRAFLSEDWEKFNTHVKDTKDWLGKPSSVDWSPRVTPPIPTNWPPQERRSVTFYAYGEYQEEVNAIREYYCQWALTNRTADLIKDNHRAFFAWLDCPRPSAIPVLAARRL